MSMTKWMMSALLLLGASLPGSALAQVPPPPGKFHTVIHPGWHFIGTLGGKVWVLSSQDGGSTCVATKVLSTTDHLTSDWTIT